MKLLTPGLVADPELIFPWINEFVFMVDAQFEKELYADAEEVENTSV
jgi:hypothetical protein